MNIAFYILLIAYRVLTSNTKVGTVRRYVCSTAGRYNTRYAKYTQDTQNYWTSCWSPIGSR